MRRRALLTSLAAALWLTAAAVAQTPPPVTLGEPGETLEQAVAEAEMAAQGTKMKVSVSAVGFGISPTSAAAQELQAAASAGGGAYVPAAEVGQLAGALQAAAGGQAAPAGPIRGKAALLPAAVLRGSDQNGPRITLALEGEARKEGLAVLPAADLAGALGGVDLKLPQPLMRLAEIGRATGVDWVIYPRVLSVGKPFNTKNEDERIMTILVNVVDVKTGRLAHTFQIGAIFTDPTFPMEAVAPQEVANEAAVKLLAGLIEKLPPPR